MNNDQLTKVITGKVRFSYANVWEAKSIDGGEPKYSVSLIIPKSDKKTIAAINAAIEQAKKDGKSKVFEGKIPGNLKTPLRDGDAEREDDDAYKNSFFVNANSKNKPKIVDRYVKEILDQEEFYSGCYGKASITFYPFNRNGNKGIACGLQHLQKISDGEPLSYRSRAEDDFEVVGDEEEIDDILS